MKRLLLTLIIITMLMLPAKEVSARSTLYIVISSQSAGIEKDLARRINDTPYHAFFSLGKGPFLPLAGFSWRWEKEKYIVSFNFSGGTSPGETDFGAPINLSAFSISGEIGYSLLNYKRITLGVTFETGFINFSFVTPYFTSSTTTLILRGGLETKYVFKKEKDFIIFTALAGGVQYPSSMGEVGYSFEPYYLKISLGVGR